MLNSLTKKLTTYGFGTRSLTEEDFHRICADFEIEVIYERVKRPFYMRLMDQEFIVLNRRSRGLRNLFDSFHELAHALEHGGKSHEVALFRGLVKSKEEVEADTFALLAIIPESALESFLEENSTRFARKLFRERERVRVLFGL
ncbi:MAG: ImmA/IrrE family metallo-endopeptidase [Pyrinomonadaceae bacterium]